MSGCTRVVGALASILIFATTPAGASLPLSQQVERARDVLADLLGANQRPPSRLLEATACVAVVPRLVKGAVGIGGHHGKGVLSCRSDEKGWSAPAFLKITGGSVGLQFGAASTDLVLLIIDERSARAIMRSKFTLGGDASVAAGPLSASADATTDVSLDAEIYSYENSKGFFAGVSLEGAKLRLNRKAVSQYYPEHPRPEDLLFGGLEIEIPAEAARFVEVLP